MSLIRSSKKAKNNWWVVPKLASCSYELDDKFNEFQAILVDSFHKHDEKFVWILVELVSSFIVIGKDEDQNLSNGRVKIFRKLQSLWQAGVHDRAPKSIIQTKSKYINNIKT